MGKYTSYEKIAPPRSNQPHPIWNGIGCLIILIVPVISYALSMLTVEYAVNQGVQIPEELTGYPVVPRFLFGIPGVGWLAGIIQGQYYLYSYLLLTVFFIILVFGIIGLVYAFMFRATGQSRFSGLNSLPPPSSKVRKYKR